MLSQQRGGGDEHSLQESREQQQITSPVWTPCVELKISRASSVLISPNFFSLLEIYKHCPVQLARNPKQHPSLIL